MVEKSISEIQNSFDVQPSKMELVLFYQVVILRYLISQSLDIKAFFTAKSFLYFFKSGLVAQAATAPTNKTHEIDTKCGDREAHRK